MPNTCKTCRHPQREAIEKAILAQVALRVIARQFGIHNESIRRHAIGHLPAKLNKSKTLQEYGSAERLGKMMVRLITKTRKVGDAALKYSEYGPAVSATVAERGHIETLGKLSGAISAAQPAPGGGGQTVIAVTINYGEDWRGREVEEGEVVEGKGELESGTGRKNGDE